MENTNEQTIIGELIPFLNGIFPSYPELNLIAYADQTFTFISNSAQDYRRLQFDIVVHKNDRAFIIIEIKSSKFINEAKDTSLISIASAALSSTNACFFIFTDGNRYKLIDGTNYQALSEISKQDIVGLFERAPEVLTIHENISYLYNTLKEELDNIGFLNKWNDLFDNLAPEEVFEYNDASSVYNFRGDPFDLQSHENQFFQKLLPPFDDDIVFRYTTGASLESLLKNNTFRINGLVGMNDPSEVDYVDDYIFSERKPLDEIPQEQLEQINRVYISSCSLKEKEDDLTMWRLYGDDSKGVCYKLKVLNQYLDHNMILGRVSYGTKTRHKELDCIKKFLENFKTYKSALIGFKTFETWKHFFKPYQYEVEQEVRLLYIKNDIIQPLKESWVVTYSDKIYNPCVDFKLNGENFPLQLTVITLGPNSPYRNVNIAQLKEYIRQLSERMDIGQGPAGPVPEYLIEELEVKISSINNYRKT